MGYTFDAKCRPKSFLACFLLAGAVQSKNCKAECRFRKLYWEKGGVQVVSEKFMAWLLIRANSGSGVGWGGVIGTEAGFYFGALS